MIDQKDVVRMRVPFPNLDSKLAVQAHMYVCVDSGTQKEFVKCQTFKPTHLIRSKPPYRCIVETPDIKRNPFQGKTTIDCDKSFYIENVVIDRSLLTTKRKDICEDLFTSITSVIGHVAFAKKVIDLAPFLSLNQKISSEV
ncbi:hypothetical protein [Oceanobacillus sp. CF4.6]|uniref:hypothetical protein n=1 Tax=Oceanobacillus sp. CF4.6 TaxID=3373080 RepID=UPI003EE5ED55